MIFRKRWLAAGLVLSPIVVLGIASLSIAISGLNDELHAADLGVVLGSKVDRDGRPSTGLQARLDHAVELYRQGYFKQVLVSGGHGREGYDEAVVMGHYLEAHGVPSGAILEDNDGYTTWMTARNTARIMEQRRFKSALIISEYFHMTRCRLAFEKYGISPVYTSHASFWSVRNFYSLPREVAGCVVYSLRKPDDVDPTTETD
jgi:vancomycin permeability regulator SanA